MKIEFRVKPKGYVLFESLAGYIEERIKAEYPDVMFKYELGRALYEGEEDEADSIMFNVDNYVSIYDMDDIIKISEVFPVSVICEMLVPGITSSTEVECGSRDFLIFNRLMGLGQVNTDRDELTVIY